MTTTQHSTPGADFADGRARAEEALADQQRRAVRTIAGQARDHTDFSALLSMLGLVEPAHRPVTLNRWLPVYVQQVAAAIGVPTEAIGYEVSDTATAYLALDVRCPTRPGHDLMLVWDERLGWYVAVETDPADSPAVLAYLDGDAVPTPAAVRQFVTAAAAGTHATRLRPALPPTDRTTLAEKMSTICRP